ncbi:hypothetical protein SDRG_16687 [Saprolegnia diclina VS20]|uniref:Uncharacterized protein n=1 Tax=Saprolegnia diclina (strain VS20) TaxID=1156394 RepID=T0PT89_SAPDV|nr:hypothetical protein SDRG_16687 [Saprolegnia diclina VS20]EQC25441.1 hypothetical protein SDRG_16687 [Saprolegnia diclina VS20]|eukprot:XP_008621127.1 hypothetical protein SDRG_16687 [Saprolegnia diclina VS20]
MRILEDSLIHVNLRDSSGTPLQHLVVATQDASLLQMLLKKPDLQLDAKDATGRTALAIALTTGNTKTSLALLHAGASVELVDKVQCASAPDFVAALRQVASSNDTSSVVHLLRLGVSCSLANEQGETVWHVAAAKGHLSILMMLVQREIKGENGIDATNHNGESPVFVAAIAGHADVVQCLLRANANPISFPKYCL